jgi:translation machinery-associated protein 16
LTLGDLRQLVRDIWLTRFDEELESHRSARRSGRPKSTKEMKLEALKLREAETYRTGMGTYFIRVLSLIFCLIIILIEVIDLTHAPTVELFRKWDQKEVAYIQLLRFIRIFSTDPNLVIVSRPGKHASIIGSSKQTTAVDIPMDTDNADCIHQHPNSIIPGEPMPRFSSTIMNMDS